MTKALYGVPPTLFAIVWNRSNSLSEAHAALAAISKAAGFPPMPKNQVSTTASRLRRMLEENGAQGDERLKEFGKKQRKDRIPLEEIRQKLKLDKAGGLDLSRELPTENGADPPEPDTFCEKNIADILDKVNKSTKKKGS